jgi:hypothetical protein
MDYEKLNNLPKGYRDLLLKVKFSNRHEYEKEIQRKYREMLEVINGKENYTSNLKKMMAIRILANFYCKSFSYVFHIVNKKEK